MDIYNATKLTAGRKDSRSRTNNDRHHRSEACHYLCVLSLLWRGYWLAEP